MNKEEFINFLRGILSIIITIFSAIIIAFSIWGGIWFIERQMSIYDHKIQYNKIKEELKQK